MNAENDEGQNASLANDGSSKGLSTSCCCGSVLKSALVIVALSSFLALTTNALRSSGSIDLSRNYFRTLQAPVNPVQEQDSNGSNSEINSAGNTGENISDQDTTSGQEEAQPDDGIQRLTFEDVHDHFMTAEEMVGMGESIVAFVDARVRDQYEEGHIPGALWLYHYESGDLIDALRPQLEMAFFIIVYCNGGDCEDSLYLAADLGSLYGLPPENIYVYEGGLNEWKEREMPVVTGSEAR